MSKRDDLIAKYASELKEKCGVEPDMELLTKVTIGCGPSIYNQDSSTVSDGDSKELATVKNNFLVKKLGLADSQELESEVKSVMASYGKPHQVKYRAVVYYMLVKNLKQESYYD